MAPGRVKSQLAQEGPLSLGILVNCVPIVVNSE